MQRAKRACDERREELWLVARWESEEARARLKGEGAAAAATEGPLRLLPLPLLLLQPLAANAPSDPPAAP